MNRKQRKARLKYLNSLPKEYKKRKQFAKKAKLTALLLSTENHNKRGVTCSQCVFGYNFDKVKYWCAKGRYTTKETDYYRFHCSDYIPLPESMKGKAA